MIVCLLAVDTAWAIAADPRGVVVETTERVLGILRNEREIIREQPARVLAIIDDEIVEQVDFALMSRWVLGRYWRQASPVQREAFAKEFRTLVIRTYATALLGYTTETVNYGSTTGGSGASDVVVKTVIERSHGPSIPVDYRLRRDDTGRWKVYDLVIDGVSLLMNYRSSFASEIQRGGLDQLIDRLSEHNKSAAFQ